MEENDVNVEEYCEFAHKVTMTLVKRYSIPGDAVETLLSAAQLALVEAAGRYDVSRQATFKTYAFARIRGAVLDEIRAFARRQGYQNNEAEARAVAEESRTEQLLSITSCGDPSDQSVMAGILEYLYEGGMSINGSLRQGAASGPSSIGITSPTSPEAELLANEQRNNLKQKIEMLPHPDRFVVEQYYFNDITMEEIGKKLGDRTKSWVSRIHSRAIKRLQDGYNEAR